MDKTTKSLFRTIYFLLDSHKSIIEVIQKDLPHSKKSDKRLKLEHEITKKCLCLLTGFAKENCIKLKI